MNLKTYQRLKNKLQELNEKLRTCYSPYLVDQILKTNAKIKELEKKSIGKQLNITHESRN